MPYFYTPPDRPNQVIKVAKPAGNCGADLGFEKLFVVPSRETTPTLLVSYIWAHTAVCGFITGEISCRKGDEAALGDEVDVVVAKTLPPCSNASIGTRALYGNLSGRTLLVGFGWDILLCEFSGSYIGGGSATISGQVGFRPADEAEYTLPAIRAELRYLGSLFYVIATRKQTSREKRRGLVLRHVAQGDHQDVVSDIAARVEKLEATANTGAAELSGKRRVAKVFGGGSAFGWGGIV